MRRVSDLVMFMLMLPLNVEETRSFARAVGWRTSKRLQLH